jgi:hypothetical protein
MSANPRVRAVPVFRQSRAVHAPGRQQVSGLRLQVCQNTRGTQLEIRITRGANHLERPSHVTLGPAQITEQRTAVPLFEKRLPFDPGIAPCGRCAL